jgi:hypothetical protein
MTEVERLREVLARIAEAVRDANNGVAVHDGENGTNEPDSGPPADAPGCSVKALPKRLLMKAAATAMRINPVNAPQAAPAGAGADMGITDPMRIAVLTAKYWGPTPRRLTVSFLDGPSADLRRKILRHMNAWSQTACISFVETSGTGQVRITRGNTGHWSYLGTDILHIPTNRATMNLQGFSMNTEDSEFFRVVRHETGHTLGFPHEHMRKELVARIDPRKAYKWFLETQGWDKAMVDAQVLTPLDDRSIFGTRPDQTSIMCYQLPAAITKDNRPILGGADINATDFGFAGRIYPRPGAAPAADLNGDGTADADWTETEDVEVAG